jgi:FixJ family two-component response regulator
MISGYSEQDVAQQVSKFGTCAFIQKPFSPNELIDAINTLHAQRVDADRQITEKML